MSTYARIFVNISVGEIAREFDKVLALATRLKLPAAEAEILKAFTDYNRGLDRIAKATAVSSRALIEKQLAITAKRPDTGMRPHLRSNIRSRPLLPNSRIATGAVGVADIKALERAVNPADRQKVPYWKVQEEGTTKNVGRTLKGYFFDKGLTNATRPAPGYTGSKSAQPLFRPGFTSTGAGTGPRGGRGGKGVITHPIKARHFVRDGADKALIDYKNEMRALESATITELARVFGGPGGAGRYVRRP